MKLPKISHPTFKEKIPSTGAIVRLRPFTVREEKILLLANTSEDPISVVEAIQQVVNNCLVDDELDVRTLATFDIEYLFVKLRAKSVGETIDLMYTDPTDDETYKLSVDLSRVDIKFNERHKNKVLITPDGSIGVTLRYPKPEVIYTMKGALDDVDVLFKIIKYCLETVWDGENVSDLTTGEASDEEVNEFLESLDPKHLEEMKLFLDTIPKLYYEVPYKRKDGTETKLVLQTLSDFFSLG